jgi:hypothetical protein
LGQPSLQGPSADGVRQTGMEGVDSYPLGMMTDFFENSDIRIGG